MSADSPSKSFYSSCARQGLTVGDGITVPTASAEQPSIANDPT